jgi:hypothetical protein
MKRKKARRAWRIAEGKRLYPGLSNKQRMRLTAGIKMSPAPSKEK